MKNLALSFFALLCLVAVVVVSATSEVPEAAPTATLNLVATEGFTEAPACNPALAFDVGGQETTQSFSNNCSIGCSTSNCQGVPRGNPCFLGSGRGWGSCNLYLGVQCSDGTGWDCICYGPGGAIP